MAEYQGGFLISQIKQMSGRLFNQLLAKKNIDAFNGEQGRILYILWEEDYITIRELAKRTGLAVTTLTSMLDRMEQAELIMRNADASDRRKTLISLTDNAKSLKNEYEEVSTEMSKLFYSGFSKKEIMECENYLKRILGNISEAEI
ncbi:MarR family transcriptional regulator [Clostridium sp. SHJSY1]|uniref:MarR family winged helix-turn-helix transcriptional regulator n=1 Tax=Clostridium sp. SHJSY1 TaxID=2942483 RepID=UPI0028745B1C|nr:MarR family transcriptional regulator [Clostridium sp. SHJSY1]MDS0526691.1 MarR family transcriptional regulator [Clostridium sp. SHJSY1]